LSKGWRSENVLLDEFIIKSQEQTASANDASLEWVPFSHLNGSPTDSDTYTHDIYSHANLELIPIEKTKMTANSYFDEVNIIFNAYEYIIKTNFNITINYVSYVISTQICSTETLGLLLALHVLQQELMP